MEDYSKLLSEYRERMGMTQARLALQLGISRVMVSQIESGTRKPSVKMRHMINGALGLDLGEWGKYQAEYNRLSKEEKKQKGKDILQKIQDYNKKHSKGTPQETPQTLGGPLAVLPELSPEHEIRQLKKHIDIMEDEIIMLRRHARKYSVEVEDLKAIISEIGETLNSVKDDKKAIEAIVKDIETVKKRYEIKQEDPDD
jgi:transcriptional regulator with XRE-family HTH domain